MDFTIISNSNWTEWADTLPWWWSSCVSMTQRAVPAGTLVPGRSNHAGLVEG